MIMNEIPIDSLTNELLKTTNIIMENSKNIDSNLVGSVQFLKEWNQSNLEFSTLLLVGLLLVCILISINVVINILLLRKLKKP